MITPLPAKRKKECKKAPSVIICLASTHTALVSSPGLAVLHLSTQPNLRLNHRAAPTLAQCNRGCSLGRLISTTCTWPWWATAISAVTGMQTGEVAVAERAPLSPLPSRLFGKEKPHKATESRLARWSCRGSRLDVAHGHRRRSQDLFGESQAAKFAREINVDPEISILALVSFSGTSRRLAWSHVARRLFDGSFWLDQTVLSVNNAMPRAGRP